MIMDKLMCCNLIQLFQEKPPDQTIRHIVKTGLSHLTKKDFMQLLGYLLEIVHPEGYKKLSKINVQVTKSEEHRFRGNLCTLLSGLSEMYPDAPPLPKVLPSHLIHPVGDNITVLLWTLSVIALIVCLQKNHGVEVEKYPSGDNIPKSTGINFAQLAVKNEEAVINGEQEKEALVKMFVDENRDLRLTIGSIKQETTVLKEVLRGAIDSLNLDETLKCQLADLNTEPPFADIQACLENRFKEVETILNNLELCPVVADNCRSLLEYYEFQKSSPVYLCGEQLRQKFPHLKLKDDQLSLENILEQSAEKLGLLINELESFKILCEENQVEIKLEEALSQLNSYACEAATYRVELEELAEALKNKYWEHMGPLLEKRKEGCVQEPFYDLCRFVSELACLPLSTGLKLPPPAENVDYKGSNFKKDWFKLSEIHVAEPDYMFFFRKSSSSCVDKCNDTNQPSSSSSGRERLPFSTIKKQHYNPALRGKERMMHLASSPSSPANAETGNESFPDVKFPISLEKKVRKVLMPSTGDSPDVYTSTPPRYSEASEGSISYLTEISKPWHSNVSWSSEDSDRLD